MRGESGHEGFVLFVRTDQAKGLFWIQKLWDVGKKEGNSSSTLLHSPPPLPLSLTPCRDSTQIDA